MDENHLQFRRRDHGANAQEWHGVYFAVADPDLEYFLPKGEFERSLILNCLFQSGVLIPDTFLFKSRGVEDHVLGKPYSRSLFEALIEVGIVRPMFRDPQATDFNSALQSFATQMGTGNVGDRSDKLANRLDQLSFSYGLWPSTSVGEGFATWVKRFLQSDQPPHINSLSSPRSRSKLRKEWSDTERWRHDTIAIALEQVSGIPGAGLRRTEILTAIGHAVGLIGNFYTVDQLLPLVPEGKRASVTKFLRWVFEIYHFNHALMFDASPNFLASREHYSFVVPNLLPAANVGGFSQVSAPPIEIDVSIPKLDVLANLPPSVLIEARTRDAGRFYFEALEAWYLKPGDDELRRLVCGSLEEYAKSLRIYASRHQEYDEVRMHAVHQSRRAMSRELLHAFLLGAGSASTVAAAAGQAAPALVVAGGGVSALGWAAYQFYEARPRRTRIAIDTRVNVGTLEFVHLDKA